ncbi:MAG: hypothetical protein RLZZ26_244 [Candidatus Parcubacteria bacterium]
MIKNYVHTPPVICHALGTLQVGEVYVPIHEMSNPAASLYAVGQDRRVEIVRPHIGGAREILDEEHQFAPTTLVMKIGSRRV